MTQAKTVAIRLRQGAGQPVTVELKPEELRALSQMSAAEAIERMLGRVAHPNGFASSLRATLQDPNTVIEVQTDHTTPSVLTSRSPMVTLPPETAEVDIGVARTHRGG